MVEGGWTHGDEEMSLSVEWAFLSCPGVSGWEKGVSGFVSRDKEASQTGPLTVDRPLLLVSPCPSHPGISDISGQQGIETLVLATILSEAKVLGPVVLVRTPLVSREG